MDIKEIKDLVFQNTDKFEEAFQYDECKNLFNRLITNGRTEKDAKQETLKSYNEAKWLACQEILDFTIWITRKFDGIAVSDFFNEEDVRALASKLPRLIPTNRPWFAHGLMENFPVKYKSYDKWGDNCLYTPYDVTKGYTDALLVELLYNSTDSEEGKMRLLNDIINDSFLHLDEPGKNPGWLWALSKREELRPHEKCNIPQKKEKPVDIIKSKMAKECQKKFDKFFEWMEKGDDTLDTIFEYDSEEGTLQIKKYKNTEMGYVAQVLRVNFPELDIQDWNVLFKNQQGNPFIKKEGKEFKSYKYIPRIDLKSARKKNNANRAIKFYDALNSICHNCELKSPEDPE